MEDNRLAPCVNWQEKLATLHPNALSPIDRAALNAHIASCPGCATALADDKMDSLIREAFICQGSTPLPAWLTQEDLATKLPPQPVPRLYQNLPPRFEHFLGRQIELTHILEGLNSSHSFLAIEGTGGIGKTTLALEAAYQCLWGSDLILSPLFDAAVWISASGRWNRGRWLSEVLGTIAGVLDHRSVAQLSLEEKRIKVNELLRTHQTLVIIDDFDTTDDDALLSWIQQIPAPSKVLVTSHDANPFHQAWTLRLEGLMEDDASDLISRYTQKLDLSVPESTEINKLLHITHGNPQAIATALGNVKSSGLSLHQILDELRSAEDALDHLLTRSWSTLERFPDAQRVLLATSLFEGSASKEALGRVAGIDDALLEKALTRLVDLSLVEVCTNEGKRQAHYGLHPLIRAFADTKLKERPAWEQEARERWIDWWLEFTKVHGGPDRMEEWTEHYGLIDEERVNLSLVWEWCVAHSQYEILQAFWHSERLLWMTSIYGCWKFRLTWLRRITKAAEKRGDKATALEAMVEQGFTLTQMGRIEEAGEMLKEAWKQNHFLSLGVQTTLAENLVQWHMRTNNFAGAQYWLEEANRLVRNLGELERPRHSLTIQYYFGVVCIAKGDKKQAEMYFQETLRGAQKIGWQGCMICVEQFLADIARAPLGMFGETEDLPKTDTEIVGKDRGRAAYYKYSLAYLALLQLRQNKEEKELNKMIDWAQQILKGIKLKAQPKVVRRLKAAPSSPFVVCFAR